MAILVAEDGQVENRIINVPMGLPASSPHGSCKLSQCSCARLYIG